MYQEIDVRINVGFTTAQIRNETSILDTDISNNIQKYVHEHRDTPMEVTSIESSMTNAHIRITTSIDARIDELDIGAYIQNRVKKLLPWGCSYVEVLQLREEAEIYGNK